MDKKISTSVLITSWLACIRGLFMSFFTKKHQRAGAFSVWSWKHRSRCWQSLALEPPQAGQGPILAACCVKKSAFLAGYHAEHELKCGLCHKNTFLSFCFFIIFTQKLIWYLPWDVKTNLISHHFYWKLSISSQKSKKDKTLTIIINDLRWFKL